MCREADILKEYSNKIKKLERDKERIDRAIKVLIKKRQNVCSHKRVRKGGGEEWSCYPESGRNPYWLRCIDCGLYGEYRFPNGTSVGSVWEKLNKACSGHYIKD